jgi:hypothetical protein
MNTNSNHRPVSIAFALTAAASVITVIGVGTAGAAFASEPRGDRVTSDSVSTIRSWGEPLAAFGGQSLAQYLADHWAGETAAVV